MPDCESCGEEMRHLGVKRKLMSNRMKLQRVHVYECFECLDRYLKVVGETNA